MHAHGLELLDLVGNDSLRKTEFGDTIDQNAACGVQGLKNGDLIAFLASSLAQVRPEGPEPTTAT